MADVAQLEQAFLAADRAGDTAAAKALASEIIRLREPSVTDIPLGARQEAAQTPWYMAPVLAAGSKASRIKEGVVDLVDTDPGSQREREGRVGGAGDAYKALVEKYPFLTAAGEFVATAPFKNPLGMAVAGGLEYGTPSERAQNAAMGYVGGKVGEKVAGWVGRFKGAPEAGTRAGVSADVNAGRIDAPNKWNIPTTVGMRSEWKPAQIAESVLANMPTSAGIVARGRDRAFSGFNEAVGETFGAFGAKKLTPELLGQRRDILGKEIGDIARRNFLRLDPQMAQDIATRSQAAATELTGDALTSYTKRLDDLLSRVGPNGQIPGAFYKSFDSQLGRMAKGSNDGNLAHHLIELRQTVRDAFDRSVSPTDSAAWKTARKGYHNVNIVADAAKSTGDGSLSPAALLQAVNSSQPRARFGGGNDLAEIAQWAKSTLPDKVPNSGTAQRLMYQRAIENPGAAVAALGGAGAAGWGASQVVDPRQEPLWLAPLAVPAIAASFMAGKPNAPLVRALLARSGAAAGAVGADRSGMAQLIAQALRQHATGGEQ